MADQKPKAGRRIASFFLASVNTLTRACVATLLVGGCGKKAAPPGPPPPSVTVAHPLQKEVMEWDIYTGHLEAPELANVSARVSGLITEMPFDEGSIVTKGTLLAVIDDRPFKADLDSKLADLQKANAQLALAQLTNTRYQGLRATNAVSQQDADTAAATVDQDRAVVAAANAALETSQLNLSWCKVSSPIDGRVSNKLVTTGNLVNGGAGQATLLTTVQSVFQIYCYVDVDETSVLKYQKLAAEGKLANARAGKVPCYVQLGNEKDFPHEGFIDFVDNHVDVATGTQRVRGVLDNHSGLLTPGFFARLAIPGSQRHMTMLVPDVAVTADQSKKLVMVVDKDNKVTAHPIEIGPLFGGLRSILSGLTTDDRVIINGLMQARPGATVQPTDGPVTADEAALMGPAASAANAAALATNDATPPPSTSAPSTTVATSQSASDGKP